MILSLKKVLILIWFLALLIFLFGCSQKITYGEIYKMEYQPEMTTTVIMPMIISDGKTTNTIYIPMTYHYPDRYVIYIQSFEVNDNGERETSVYYTTKEVYEQCKIGDVFSYDKERDFEEEPVEKIKEE